MVLVRENQDGGEAEEGAREKREKAVEGEKARENGRVRKAGRRRARARTGARRPSVGSQARALTHPHPLSRQIPACMRQAEAIHALCALVDLVDGRYKG